MIVRFTPLADRQILAAVEYISRDRPEAALRFVDRVERSLNQLVDYPDSGRVVPGLTRTRFREVIVKPYRFFYRAEDDVVWIVAVWHEAQDVDEPDGEPCCR